MFSQDLPTKMSHCGITLNLLVYPGKGMFNDDDSKSDMSKTECIPSVLMNLS